MKMKKIKFFIPLAFIMLAVIFLATTSVRNATLISRLTVTENLVTPTTSTFIEINGLDEVVNYRPGSTRSDADNVWADTIRHTGTMDLTTLTNSLGEALNLTGDVVVAAKFFLGDVVGATCTISNGATNSYPLFGTTYSFQLKANQSLLFKADTVLIPVSASAKNITYTGSSDAAVLYVILLTADSYQ